MVQRNRVPLGILAGALILATLGIVTAGEGNRPVEPLLREPEPLPFLKTERAVPCGLPDVQSTPGASQPDGTFVDLTLGRAAQPAPRRLEEPRPLPKLAPTPAPRPEGTGAVRRVPPVEVEAEQANVAQAAPALPPRPAASPQPTAPAERIAVVDQNAQPAVDPRGAGTTASSHTAAASYSQPMLLEAPSAVFTPDGLPSETPDSFEVLPPETVADEAVATETVPQQEVVPCYPSNCYRPGPIGCIQERWHTRIRPWLERTHWGYPEEFIQPPLGFYVAAHARTQIARGQQSLLTLYHFDFEQVGDRAQLTPRGRLQLEKFATVLAYRPFALLIERSVDDAELDQARYEQVVESLTRLEVPLAAERVVVGRPMSRGMFGPEARTHGERSLQGGAMMGAPMDGGFGVGVPGVGAGVGAGAQ